MLSNGRNDPGMCMSEGSVGSVWGFVVRVEESKLEGEVVEGCEEADGGWQNSSK